MHTFRFKGLAPLLAAGALALIPAGTAQAAAPANDNFAAPVTLTEGAPAQAYDNLDATVEAGEPSPISMATVAGCGTYTARPDCGTSTWFTFVPQTTGNYTLQTCDQGTDLDTALAVYTGATVGALTKITSNDDGNLPNNSCYGSSTTYGSRVTFAATMGTTYHVQIAGYAGQQGLFYLSGYAGSPTPAPANDTDIDADTSGAEIPTQSTLTARSGPRSTASFAFRALDPASTFECSLDGGAYTACTSPAEYNDIADTAAHVFRVRAVLAGTPDPTPAEQRFTLDGTAPDSAISTGPAEGDTIVGPAAFTLAGSERDALPQFRCTQDGVTSNCNQTTTLFGLCNGPHAFAIAAYDLAGNLDATPATRNFSASGGTACAAPTMAAPDPVTPSPTDAGVGASITTGGYAQRVTFRWGTTSAYGEEASDIVPADVTGVSEDLYPLAPGTTYHYSITIAGPNGSATTGDQTFTTPALPSGDALPAATVGTPVVGRHSVRIPIQTDVGAPANSTTAQVFVATDGPARISSFEQDSASIPSTATGQQPTSVTVTDLAPGTTYHYRVVVTGKYSTGTEDRTFTTTSPPAPPAPPVVTGTATTPTVPAKPFVPPVIKPVAFKLTAKLLTFSKLKRTSTKLIIKVKGVPASTKLTLSVRGRKTLLTAKKTASSRGTATFTLKLSKKVRKALRDKKLKKVKFAFTATPPGQAKSSLTVTKTLPKR